MNFAQQLIILTNIHLDYDDKFWFKLVNIIDGTKIFNVIGRIELCARKEMKKTWNQLKFNIEQILTYIQIQYNGKDQVWKKQPLSLYKQLF